MIVFTINIVYVYLGPANLYSIIIIISFHLFIYILYYIQLAEQSAHTHTIHSLFRLHFFSFHRLIRFDLVCYPVARSMICSGDEMN